MAGLCEGHKTKLSLSPDGAWGSLTSNNTWNGMVGMIVRGEAEMAITAFTMTKSRLAYVNFMAPYWSDGSSELRRTRLVDTVTVTDSLKFTARRTPVFRLQSTTCRTRVSPVAVHHTSNSGLPVTFLCTSNPSLSDPFEGWLPCSLEDSLVDLKTDSRLALLSALTRQRLVFPFPRAFLLAKCGRNSPTRPKQSRPVPQYQKKCLYTFWPLDRNYEEVQKDIFLGPFTEKSTIAWKEFHAVVTWSKASCLELALRMSAGSSPHGGRNILMKFGPVYGTDALPASLRVWGALLTGLHKLAHSTIESRSLLTLFIRKPDDFRQNMNQYTSPFSGSLWIAVTVSLLLLALGLATTYNLRRRYAGFLENNRVRYTFARSSFVIFASFCQQRRSKNHTARISMDAVNALFPGRVISRKMDIAWPPRSPDLTVCDFFLWGHLKTKVFGDNPLRTIPATNHVYDKRSLRYLSIC
ncbi:hypothetical protein ANN_19539 [Periplaneta americana]|uniref:Ionotropic glutamate receptor L-glutamate and glycine-binding domain-containing protein n=1 Tax=Periplaneta americana TaxID=6978 RepID=A0ABQ8SA73_PERAM|nr:hypothetical protein ANN_19539 [Periplaneta americana]